MMIKMSTPSTHQDSLYVRPMNMEDQNIYDMFVIITIAKKIGEGNQPIYAKKQSEVSFTGSDSVY